MIEISKDQVWEATFDRVARTADGMGRRIDLGVMGLVLALNAHGVRTTGSCEGHMDHGHPFPWVWVPEADSGLLVALLGAFYARGSVPRDRMLTSGYLLEDTYILQPRGAALQERRVSHERAVVLKEYQQEAIRFAEWLRDRFFEEEACHAA
jgi:hypothetical protein